MVADLEGEQAEAAAAGIRDAGGDALAVAVDVSDAAAVERLAATTIERYGRVDVLCNNAGVSTFNLMRDQTLDDWKWVFDVNFWGVVHGIHTFVPIMREQGTPGHVVNTASIGGLLSGIAFIGPYCATKAAVVSISETLAPGARDRPDAHRRERAVPELGRHQGHGVGAQPAAGVVGVEQRTEMAESVRLMIRDGFTGPTGQTPAQVAARVLEAIAQRRVLDHHPRRPVPDRRGTRDRHVGGVPTGRRLTRGLGLRDRSRVRGAARSGCATFIDRELIPLEPIFDELPADEWAPVKRHLQEQVKARGLWGAFLDPKLGGAGFGQLKLALMSEIIGRCMMSMTIFGVQAPDSGNMELLAHGATDAQKERWLWPNLRGEISSAFALTEPFLAGADPTVIGTTATQRRRRVGDRRAQVVHHQRVGRRHRARVRRDQPRGPAAPARVDVRRARRHAGHGDRARHRHDGAPRRRVRARRQPRRDRVPRLPGAGRPPDRRARATGSCSRSSGSAAGASTTRCAGSARRSGRSTSCASARCRGRRTASCSAQHQMVQDYVALSHMEIQAARLLTFQTAWKMDKYGAAAVRADLGMVKAHVSKVVLAVLDRTIQVCGALGYSSDLPVESWYRAHPLRPDRRRPRRAAQVGAGPHAAEGLQAGRGLADRAHPEPAPGGRGEVAGAAGRRGRVTRLDRALTVPRAVFFDFAGTLFSSRDLRDAHLAQLRAVADAVGVTADRPTSSGPRTGRGWASATGRSRPARTTCTASCSRRSFAATAEALGGSLDDAACDALVDRQYAATLDADRAPSRLPRHPASRSGSGACARRSSRTSTTSSSTGWSARLGLDARDRHLDQLRVGAARASPMPASTRWRSRASRVRRGARCCSSATPSSTTSSGRARQGMRTALLVADARPGTPTTAAPTS